MKLHKTQNIERNSVPPRQPHEFAFDAICDFIEQDVVLQQKSVFMTKVLDLYQQKFEEAGGSSDDIKNYKVQALKRKIEKKMDNVAFRRVNVKQGNIIFSRDVEATGTENGINATR